MLKNILILELSSIWILYILYIIVNSLLGNVPIKLNHIKLLNKISNMLFDCVYIMCEIFVITLIMLLIFMLFVIFTY